LGQAKVDPDDERDRFRLTPKVEQKFRAVDEILGVELNAAIAVCGPVHHHQLRKPRCGHP